MFNSGTRHENEYFGILDPADISKTWILVKIKPCPSNQLLSAHILLPASSSIYGGRKPQLTARHTGMVSS